MAIIEYGNQVEDHVIKHLPLEYCSINIDINLLYIYKQLCFEEKTFR